MHRSDPSGAGLPSLSPWSNAAGGAKSIILDADAAGLKIQQSHTEITVQSVLDDLRNNVVEPMYSRVLNYLQASTITAVALSE